MTTIPLSQGIRWDVIEKADKWLDDSVSETYKTQPLAQDWARVVKVIEEIGEAIANLILYTGQNPRKVSKNPDNDETEMLLELADTAVTAILGIQHFTKDTWTTRHIVQSAIAKIESRIPDE